MEHAFAKKPNKRSKPGEPAAQQANARSEVRGAGAGVPLFLKSSLPTPALEEEVEETTEHEELQRASALPQEGPEQAQHVAAAQRVAGGPPEEDDESPGEEGPPTSTPTPAAGAAAPPPAGAGSNDKPPPLSLVVRALQPKLTVGAPHTHLEAQADDVAQRADNAATPAAFAVPPIDTKPVVQRLCTSCADARELARAPEDGENVAATGVVQRTCEACGEQPVAGAFVQRACHDCADEDEIHKVQAKAEPGGPALRSARDISRAVTQPGQGHALPDSVRERVEPVLGVGLGHVRVHDDPTAQGAARVLRAKAFTHGDHIWLGPGQSASDVRLLAHEATHVVQQGRGGAREDVQRAPADHQVTSDGAVPQRRLNAQVASEVGELPSSDAVEARSRSRDVDRAQLGSRSEALKDTAKPGADRPAQEGPGIDAAASQAESETQTPPDPVADANGAASVQAAGGTRTPAAPGDQAIAAARGLFAQAQGAIEPSDETPVQPVPAAAPTDAGGEPAMANPDAEAMVQDLAGGVQQLRAQGTALRRRAAVERSNANVLRGNITLIRGGIASADESVTTAKEHVAVRRDVVEKGREGLSLSEEKQRVVAAEAPSYVSKAAEGKEDSGPMASEAASTKSENDANAPEDADAAAKNREQGQEIDNVDQGAQTMDGAITATEGRGESLIEDAAAAAAKNAQVATTLDSTDEELTSTDGKLDEMAGQSAAARAQVDGLASQPATVEQRANTMDQGATALIQQSFELESRLHLVPKNIEAGMQSMPKSKPYEPEEEEQEPPLQAAPERGTAVTAAQDNSPLEQEASDVGREVTQPEPLPDDEEADIEPDGMAPGLDEADAAAEEPEVGEEAEAAPEDELSPQSEQTGEDAEEEVAEPARTEAPPPSEAGAPVVQRTPEPNSPPPSAAEVAAAAEPQPDEELRADEAEREGEESDGEADEGEQQGAESQSGEQQGVEAASAPLPEPDIEQVPERSGYDAREQVDLVGGLPGWLTGRDPQTEQERAQHQAREQQRQRDEVDEIRARYGDNLENASALDKMGVVTGALTRDAMNALGLVRWPGWGAIVGAIPGLVLAAFDPRSSLVGVVSGLQLMLSGGANLLSLEQWRRDPLGNLLKNAADIATGLTVILGSITALAGAIAAIMTAITILSLGFAAPITGPIISFCTTVMITVGGWTIAVGKIALVLQALALIKNLIDAATATTATELQSETDQVRADVRQGANIVGQIAMASMARAGARATRAQITGAGGGTRFASGLGGSQRAARAFRGARIGGASRMGAGVAALRGVGRMWRGRIGGVGRGLWSGVARGGRVVRRVGLLGTARGLGRRMWSGLRRGFLSRTRGLRAMRRLGFGRSAVVLGRRAMGRVGGWLQRGSRMWRAARRLGPGGVLRLGARRGARGWRAHSGFDNLGDAWRYTTGRPPLPRPGLPGAGGAARAAQAEARAAQAEGRAATADTPDAHARPGTTVTGERRPAPLNINGERHTVGWSTGPDGRRILTLCSPPPCGQIAQRAQQLLDELPANHPARQTLGEIADEARRLQALEDAGTLTSDLSTRTRLAERLEDVGRNHPEVASRLTAGSALRGVEDAELGRLSTAMGATSDEARSAMIARLDRLRAECDADTFAHLARDPERLGLVLDRVGGPDELAGILARIRRQNPGLDAPGLFNELERHVNVLSATAQDVSALQGRREGPAVSRSVGTNPGQLTGRRTNYVFPGGVRRFQDILDNQGVDAAYREIAQLYANGGTRIHPELERRLRGYLTWIQAERAAGRGGGLSIQQGVPGTHAEIRSYNDALLAGDTNPVLAVRRLQGNTLGETGSPFVRCDHCEEITLDIHSATDDLTGQTR